jgi:antitoxin YefM
MKEISYSHLRETLASVLDDATDNREVYVIHRQGHPDVALIAAGELSSLMETVHLIRSPKNRKRLLEALERSRTGEGVTEVTMKELEDIVKGSK